MRPNPGHCPAEAVGRRVRGVLANGEPFGKEGGWPADGRFGCRWTLTKQPFDIATYEVIG